MDGQKNIKLLVFFLVLLCELLTNARTRITLGPYQLFFDKIWKTETSQIS